MVCFFIVTLTFHAHARYVAFQVQCISLGNYMLFCVRSTCISLSSLVCERGSVEVVGSAAD